VNSNKYAVFRPPASSKCKNGCIFQTLVTFCELATFIANIYDLQVSIDFSFLGDALLGFWLLKNVIFRGENQSVCLLSQKNVWIEINILHLGSLLDVDVKNVACFIWWLLFGSSIQWKYTHDFWKKQNKLWCNNM